MATIRVETFEFIGSQLVPRAIRLLRERVQVQVEVVEAEPTEAVELLRAGELNAGLIYDSADDPAFATPELGVTVLLEEPYQVLMARDSPFAVGFEVDLRALADADWICSRDDSDLRPGLAGSQSRFVPRSKTSDFAGRPSPRSQEGRSHHRSGHLSEVGGRRPTVYPGWRGPRFLGADQHR